MRVSRRRIGLTALTVLVLVAGAMLVPRVRESLQPVTAQMRTEKTVEDRLTEFTDARERIRKQFETAGVPFPPAGVVLLGLKDEKRLDVYASSDADADAAMRRVASYPIRAASGVAGPKLREGDKQVPEGVYPVELLNPNSRFHVALRVGYPSPTDRANAEKDGRVANNTPLGGDIMIHGGAASVGCLAMGDPAAEDLFVLTALTGIDNVTIVIAPLDLRSRELPAGLEGAQGDWRRDLYATLRHRLSQLPP